MTVYEPGDECTIELADGGLVKYLVGNVKRVGDRGGLPQSIRYEHPGSDRLPGVQLVIEVVDGVPWCTFVGLAGQPRGPQVRASDMKAIAGRLEELIQSALVAVAFIRDDKDKYWHRTFRGTQPMAPTDTRRQALPEIRRARKRSNRKVTDDLLKQVAEAYRNGGPAPTNAVERAFGCSHRTAGRYVTLAREAGLLPETTQGKVSK